jgi:Cdc6-like AAA superfamily ATPase
MTREEAETKSLQAAKVFSPRSPVSTFDLFAGRYSQIRSLVDSVAQAGLHVAVFGERGVGKSSLANIIDPILKVMDPETNRLVVKVNADANDTFASVWLKAFDEVVWEVNKPIIWYTRSNDTESVTLRQALSVSDAPSIDDVRKVLTRLPHSVFVFDEFDRLPRKHAAQFTDLIKVLSDNAVSATVIVVGVASTLDGLVRDHASISRSIVQIPMPRMSKPELDQILQKAGSGLGMAFEQAASDRITRMSQGLPHYTHLVGLQSVRNACQRLSFRVSVSDVQSGFDAAVKLADHTVASQFATAVHSAHSIALYADVLLACAIAACSAPDGSMGYFQAASVVEPLRRILGRPVQIATFNGHLTEFSSDKRDRILERTGESRAYRYRFRDPLMPPYVIMKGIANNKIDAGGVEKLLDEAAGADS